MPKIKTVRAKFIAENGFYRTEVLPEKDLPRMIKIPFVYKIRVTSPVVGDYFDVQVTPVGEFYLEKRTKTTATYKLHNLYQAKEQYDKTR